MNATTAAAVAPPTGSLDALHAGHIRTLCARADVALERAGREHLVIAAGVEKMRWLDDMPYPFQASPHFLAWAPLGHHPHSWIAYTPGRRPRLVYFQPDDYWHVTPAAPDGYWTAAFDIDVIRDPAEAAALLPPASASAIIGEADAALGDWRPDNPAAAVDYLHYHRAYKTPYELALMREAQRRAVRGHRAAEAAFRGGASELDIHRAYLAATGHKDTDLPYGNIIALNEHGAVLHYQVQDAERPQELRSLLIDAGASSQGYAADITRTWGNGDGEFQALVDGVDAIQQQLAGLVRAGTDYPALHLQAHRQLAGLLATLGIVDMSAEAIVETGVSAVFFPHGLGHLIGLQVHDIGGFMASDAGGTLDKPAGHPFLRLTRTLAPGMVVTIEPGLYFIDSLLARLRAGPQGRSVDWARVEHLRRFGGVRIEDEVLCTGAEPENLSRDAFAAG